MIRDEYWNMVYKDESNLGAPQTTGEIVVSEMDAQWIYKNLTFDTMVVVHPAK